MAVVFDLSLRPVCPAGAAASVPATDADALAGVFRAWLDTIGETEVVEPDLDGETHAPVLSDIPVRWPLQAPPVQPTELITIRLADQPAAEDEIATEVEADQPAPVPAAIVLAPVAPAAAPVPTAKPAGVSRPAAPELSAAPDIAIGRPLEPQPVAADVHVHAGQEAPAQVTERRPPAAERPVRIEIPLDVPAELNVPTSVPAAFARMPFAELPPALRAFLPQAAPIDPKWRSPWVDVPVAPVTVTVTGEQFASADREPQDEGQRQSFRNLQVPATVLRLAARDGVALSRTADAAELVATVRDIARPSAALASLMVAAKTAAAHGDVAWAPPALTMAATPLAGSAEAAPAVAFAEALPTFSPDTVERTADHIVRTISLAWARGRAEAQIRLNPSHFGEVAVSVKVESGRVVVRLEAEAAVVRDWLRANQPALSAALGDRELHLEQLEVSAPREEADTTSREQAQSRQSGQQAARRAKRDQPGQLFEVVE